MALQGEYAELPELPELEPSELETILARHAGLRVGSRIAGHNLAQSQGDGEAFFDGIPDEDEAAQILGVAPEAAAVHLAIEAHAGAVILLRLELHHYDIPRKRSGYVSTESGVRGVLLERCISRFGTEFSRRFGEPLPLKRMEHVVLSRITAYEGATIGRLYRLLLGLREAEELIDAGEQFDDPGYHEALRGRAIRFLKARAGWTEEGMIGGREQSSRAPAKAAPVESRVPAAGLHENLSAQEAAGRVRRAEDDLRFQKMVEDHDGREGAIDWQRSFRVLGPFLTARILLRRENLAPLEEWAQNAGADCRNSFMRIRNDVELTRDRLQSAGRPPEYLQQLHRISELLMERIRTS